MKARLVQSPAQRLRWVWPAGIPGRVLVCLVAVGVALRALAAISWWPTTILEDGYQTYALTDPFKDPLHPAGYGLILAGIGTVTREIVVFIFLQHLSGIASALLLWAATRRVTGSAWAGLLPAAIVLLSGDQIFLEHSIMSESFVILAVSIGLYAAVRAIERSDAWRPWPLVTGAALGVAVMIRSADLPIVVVVVLALLLAQPRLRGSWRPALATASVAGALLIAFAGANAAFGSRFGIAPSPGWYLYGRVAQFADCGQFSPPPGTAALCQNTSPSRRHSSYYYMFLPQSPAIRLFHAFGTNDALIGGWARQAAEAQPGDFLKTAWLYLRSYYAPGSKPSSLDPSTGLDPQLDFTNPGNIYFDAAAQQALEAFFGKFKSHQHRWGLNFLRSWQLVFRFGATALFVTTILTLIGLSVGPRRSRIGVLLFGAGGLSLLVAPVLTGAYSGRYTVPMAGPMFAASAITLDVLWRRFARRRLPQSAPRTSRTESPLSQA